MTEIDKALVTAKAEIIRLMREDFDPRPPNYGGHSWDDNAGAVADSILALSAVGGEAVAVKPLEWSGQPDGPGPQQAKALGLRYVVCDRQWWEENGPTTACANNDEAKAAAQADYEARIRSALMPATPPAPAVTDGDRDLAVAVEALKRWRKERGGIGFATFNSSQEREDALAKADREFAFAVSAALAALREKGLALPVKEG